MHYYVTISKMSESLFTVIVNIDVLVNYAIGLQRMQSLQPPAGVHVHGYVAHGPSAASCHKIITAP